MAAPAVDLALDDDVLDLGAANARAAVVERRAFAESFKPRERMSVLEWADTRRYMSPESNAIAATAGNPVRYSSATAPYHREIMEALSDPNTEIVAAMMPSQDGKTEILNNFIGHHIDVEPGPMLVLMPTKELAESWSKDRLTPMVRDTPALQGKVSDARSRDANNTILYKKIPGGHVTMTGSNSAAGLSARPIRDVVVDEVDRCSEDAGGEGDGIGLAFRRATTFRRGKKLLISSPTIKDKSRIHKEYMLGTQEEWHCPCPHCGEFQYIEFGGKNVSYGVKWEPGNADSAYYVCVNGCVIQEHLKGAMIDGGKWIAQNPGAGPRRRSFKKTAWASNLVSWRKLVAEWIDMLVNRNVQQLQQFFNTVNCELWDPLNGKEINTEGLIARLGQGYPTDGTLPPEIGVLTASVDTQDDRLEWAVWGWGHGEEAWLIAWELIEGDPGTSKPWRELDVLRQRTFKFANGFALRPSVTFIDSGGHHTKEVYGYTRTRQRQHVFAIKGQKNPGAPLVGKATRNNSAETILYPVGSFTGKESAANRLARVPDPGPGYIHLPEWLDAEQVAQFTRSVLVTPVNKGGRKWMKPNPFWEERGRVEQFHLYVYALAALHVLGPKVTQSLGALAQQHAAQTATSTTTVAATRGRRMLSNGID